MIEILYAQAIEAKLVEVLLGVILMLNVGAYSFLWKKIRDVESKVDEDVEPEIEDNERMILKLYKRIFGLSEDETDKGHLVETQKEFSHIEDRLDGIEDKIDIIQNEQEESHREFCLMIQELCDILAEEEDIDIDKSDLKR